MKALSNYTSLKAVSMIFAITLISCVETKDEKANTEVQEVPMLEVASDEYSELALKTFELMSEFDLDTWKEYLADDIIWYWPDGTTETRNTIKGKDNLIAWWQNWKETTGGEMTFTNHSFLPIKVNKPMNYYKFVGTGVIAYTDLTIAIQDRSTSVRQNIVFMFNDDKKISHALLYYDRTGIIELTNVVFGKTE